MITENTCHSENAFPLCENKPANPSFSDIFTVNAIKESRVGLDATPNVLFSHLLAVSLFVSAKKE